MTFPFLQGGDQKAASSPWMELLARSADVWLCATEKMSLPAASSEQVINARLRTFLSYVWVLLFSAARRNDSLALVPPETRGKPGTRWKQGPCRSRTGRRKDLAELGGLEMNGWLIWGSFCSHGSSQGSWTLSLLCFASSATNWSLEKWS